MNEKYVWLNLETGEFSNSWNKDAFGHFDITSDSSIERTRNTSWKLIKYECMNDDNFEITKHFKLR